MSRFARLSVVTLVSTYVLIAVGGFVRAMEAGLGCPDWPTCHGSLNPPSSLAWGSLKLAWIEHSHRLWAAVVVALICTQAVVAWRSRQPRPVRIACYVLVPAVLSQAVLGAVVVWLKLDAESVALHLAGALTVLGLSTYVVLRSTGREPGLVDARVARLARLTAVAVFAQMMVGSFVTGYGAGLALPGFPSWEPGAGEPARSVTLQVGHRLLAMVVAGLVVALVLRVLRTAAPPFVGLLARALAVLLAVQLLLGAMNVWADLPAWSVVPHLLVGALMWGAALAAGAVTRPGSMVAA